MEKSERAAIEGMRKLQYEADLFWQLNAFISVIRDIRKDDTAAIIEVQQRAIELQNQAFAYRCQRSTIDEMKDRYRRLMHFGSLHEEYNDSQHRELAAIRKELADRGVDANWYINEG